MKGFDCTPYLLRGNLIQRRHVVHGFDLGRVGERRRWTGVRGPSDDERREGSRAKVK